MNYKIIPIDNDIFSVNSYLIINKDNDALIVDPSFDKDVIQTQIDENKCNIVGILVTHIHQDHIYTVDHFAMKYNVPIYMSQASKEHLNDPTLNLSFIGQTHFGLEITNIKSVVSTAVESKSYKIAGFEFTINVFPGHSPGCAIFNFDEFLLTGDFVLNMTIGRFDWPGSSLEQMRESIKKFKELYRNIDLPMYSGHGQKTDVQFELTNNQYLNGNFNI
jgi:hydroxyacylglutathione hydrolase